MVYELLGINWVMAGAVRGEVWAWEGLSIKQSIANLIPLILFWVLWNERNDRAFAGDNVE